MLGRPGAWPIFFLFGVAAFWLTSAAQAEEKSQPIGTWRWEREIQDRTLKSTLTIKLKNNKLTGTYSGLGDEAAIQNVKLDGSKLSFQVDREFNGQSFTLQFQGKIEGDNLTGSITVAGRELPWKATRSLEAADVLGEWQLKITTGNGQTLAPSLKLAKEKDQLVGVYTSRFGDSQAQEIKIKGMELSFKIAGERNGNKFSVVYKGRPNGDSIKGMVDFDLGGRTGSIAFEGQRKPVKASKQEEPETTESDNKKPNEQKESKKTAVRTSKPPQSAPDVLRLIGRKIANFTLKDFRGKTHSLADYDDKKAVLVYFMGTECPLAKLYGPRVQKIAQQFAQQGLVVLGVNSNVQDSITELSSYARIHGVEFPILKDLNNKVADLIGATRTPQVFLLDQQQKVRYYGRVDAQFTFGSGVGLASPQPQRNDLAIAIEELLDGKPITVVVTETKGCIIGRSRKPESDSAVTYSKQIARLIQNRCLECHRTGQIAPFAMTNYEEVAGWGEMIAEVVREQRMPPWHANRHYGQFVNANLLTEKEKQLIYTWVENGCPQGNPADLPAPRKFHQGWFMSQKPDLVVSLPKPEKVKAEGVEAYRYIEVDPKITQDKWVKLAECMPDNRAVVHHIIVYIKPPEQKTRRNRSSNRDIRGFYFLAGFAPGTRPLVAPEGWAKKIPAGSKFVFEMHYTPIGSPQTDRSSIGLVFMDEKDVTHQMSTTNALKSNFVIPPYEPNHKVEARKTFNRDTVLLSMFPHMHMRGKSFRYELILPGPDPKREVLLDVPRYDFNWQTSYILSKPRLIPKGSVMHCTAYFDNSEDNLANPDPSKSIRWGPQTWDEMMIGWYDIGIPLNEADLLRTKENAAKEEESR